MITLVVYGQGRSVVKYMVDAFGTEKMSGLLATLGTGVDIDDALGAVYGFNIRGLEDGWRESIGADPYIEATPGPTPTPSADSTLTYRLLAQPPESGEAEPDSVEPYQFAESPEALDSPLEWVDSEVDEVSIPLKGRVHQSVAVLVIILSPVLLLAHSYAFNRRNDQ